MKKKNPINIAARAMDEAIKHGRRYGNILNSLILPKESGNVIVGFANVPL